MGMDGLSMANTGMLREATSRDFAMQTEESISKNDENKHVDKLQTQMRVKEDGHNSQSGENNKKKDEVNDEYVETEDNEDNQVDRLNISDEDLENHTFYVKIVDNGDIFELYDKDSDRLVERINAEEINQLLSKLNLASGILVNRAV